jgi:hypothetical protein
MKNSGFLVIFGDNRIEMEEGWLDGFTCPIIAYVSADCQVLITPVILILIATSERLLA